MKFNRGIMWTVLSAIGLLVILSVFEAFCGARKAKLFFNSIPLGLYWYSLVVLLVVGFFEFSRLLRKPALLIIHAGCLLILAGSMWGSEAGHRLAKHLLDIDKIPHGYIVIYEGHSQNNVLTNDLEKLAPLPFSIKLNDFRIKYYEEQRLIRDYFSDVTVIKDGKEVSSKTIEVNYPLHYGGYHFYQHSYDLNKEKYTILAVVSDSGLYTVYVGYWLLCLGVLWQFWFRHIVGYIKKNQMRHYSNGN
ncbi:MAG: cytochrome c biogenesis protein ResB [Planctomycetes bacterium]|nr:cytochrome c biogenesis protein ResB [Planctomycetota bacterium]MBL7106456.1 cytochrome c biogenesis protein ResB [Phycisphaerae bacterium]